MLAILLIPWLFDRFCTTRHTSQYLHFPLLCKHFDWVKELDYDSRCQQFNRNIVVDFENLRKRPVNSGFLVTMKHGAQLELGVKFSDEPTFLTAGENTVWWWGVWVASRAVKHATAWQWINGGFSIQPSIETSDHFSCGTFGKFQIEKMI